MNNTTTHDKFIRAMLSDKGIAEAYFRNFLPPPVEKQLDLSSLTLESCTYISPQLQETMSDIVYSCETRSAGKKVKISLLIEHKSYPEKYTPVQIGCYIFSALQQQIRSKQPLSVVIPVLLYHGKGRWKYCTLDALFAGVDEEWRAYIPNFAYIYNNLGQISDEQIEQLNHSFLKASILTLKHTFEKLWLNFHAPRLLELTAENEQHLKQIYLTYLLQRASFEEKRLIEMTAPLPEKHKSDIMNTFQKIMQRGRAEGIVEGIEKGTRDNSRKIALAMLSDGFTIEKICKITGLTVEEVLEISSSSLK